MYRSRRQQGIALITAIAFLVITLALVGTALVVTTTNLRLSRSNSQTIQTQFAAESAIDSAIAQVWHAAFAKARDNLDSQNDTSPVSVDDLREVWGNDELNIGALLSGTDVDENGETISVFGEPVTINGTFAVDDAEVDFTVDVQRLDQSDSRTIIRMVADSEIKRGDEIVARRRLQQDLQVDYPPFAIDFALLSDFLNCTFCHSAFLSIEASYSRTFGMSSTNFPDTFPHFANLVDLTKERNWQGAAEGKERVRVAALSDLAIASQPSLPYLNTLVAGTIYTRGNLAQRTQNLMHNRSCTQQPSVRGPKCNVYTPFYTTDENGKPTTTISDTWGPVGAPGLNLTNEKLFSCTSMAGDGNAGCLEAHGRFYENYPLQSEDVPAIDGAIPQVDNFPTPIQDRNGDRIIDNQEWQRAVRNVRVGRLTDGDNIWFSPTDDNGVPQTPTGTVVNFTVPIQTRTGSQTVSIPMNKGVQAVNTAAAGNPRGIPGNLILLGSDTSPITFNGNIYVDGDVVISGPINPGNRGVILARGNVYIAGDILYDCNANNPGLGCDYTKLEDLPRFALVAAGAVMVGDPVATRPAGNLSNLTQPPPVRYPLQGEMYNFNRLQWDRYQATGATPRYYVQHFGDQLAWRCISEECWDLTTGIGNANLQPWYNANADSLDQGQGWTPTPPIAGSLGLSVNGGLTSRSMHVPTVTQAGGTRNNQSAVIIAISPTHNWLTPPGNAIGQRDNDALTNASGASNYTDEGSQRSRNKYLTEVRAVVSESVITSIWNGAAGNTYGNNLTDSGGIWRGDPNGRTPNNPMPLQFDGLIYTNNAILNFLPYRGSTAGGWIVNGSLISYETGLLVYGALRSKNCYPSFYIDPTSGNIGNTNLFTNGGFDWRCIGLRVQYDRRLPDLLDIRVGTPIMNRLRSEFLSIPIGAED